MAAKLLFGTGKAKSTVCLLGIIGIAVLFLVSCVGLEEPETSQESAIPGLSQAIAQILPGKDLTLVSTNKKVYVYMPVNAVEETGNLLLIVKEPNIFPDPDGKWYRENVINLDMNDDSGKFIPYPEFTKSIDVCFELSDASWKEYQKSPADFIIQMYDFLIGQWQPMDTQPRAKMKQLCAEVDQLTIYALATKNSLLQKPAPRGVYAP